MAWKCLICPLFTALVLNELLTHYNSDHRDDPRFQQVSCAIDNCQKVFVKANSFVKHVRKEHQEHLNRQGLEDRDCACDDNHVMQSGTWEKNGTHFTDETIINTPTFSYAEDPTTAHFLNNECEHHETDDGEPQGNTVEIDRAHYLQQLGAAYLLKLKSDHKLSQAATHGLIQVTSGVMRLIVEEVKTKVEEELLDAGVDSSIVTTVAGTLDSSNCNPFQEIKTPWCLNQQLKSSPYYVQPTAVILCKRKEFVKRGNKKRIVEVKDTFYYVPVLKSLAVQLGCPQVLHMVMFPQSSSRLEDFTNGTLVKEHNLFANDERALKLLIYYDEVNIASHGRAKSMHKMAMFYYQLGNIYPCYRSKLKSIQVFAVVKYDHLKAYGLNKILEPLVEELKILGMDEGHVFELPSGGKVKLRGAILAAIADTPASQAIGGFKEGVGFARKKCRHCMATFETMQDKFTEEEFTLRDYDSHIKQTQEIDEAPNKYLHDYFSKHYGINRRTKLLDAPYFDPTKQLPQDLMHIFLEGVVTYELQLLLKYYIAETKVITLKQLNDGIAGFPFGYSEVTDKPKRIDLTDLDNRENNLGQKAIEMWSLARIMPFVLGRYVDMTSDHWKLLCSLLEIMAICFSAKIGKCTLVYLKNLIKEHLTLFKRLFPHANIIPKQHYLVHIPSLMMRFGPLIRSWCMRFEAKHRYFKDVAKTIRNFTNLPLSLTSRHQEMAYSDASFQFDEHPLFRNEFFLGRSRLLSSGDLVFAQGMLQQKFSLRPESILQPQSVTIQGTLYKADVNTLLMHSMEGVRPIWGYLSKIWYSLDNNEVFFVLCLVRSSSFCEELNAYNISNPSLASEIELVKPSTLTTYNIFHSYKFNGRYYVPLRDYPFAYGN